MCSDGRAANNGSSFLLGTGGWDKTLNSADGVLVPNFVTKTSPATSCRFREVETREGDSNRADESISRRRGNCFQSFAGSPPSVERDRLGHAVETLQKFRVKLCTAFMIEDRAELVFTRYQALKGKVSLLAGLRSSDVT